MGLVALSEVNVPQRTHYSTGIRLKLEPSEKRELKVIEDVYSLILWVNDRVHQFPRQSKYTIGRRIENELSQLLGNLIDAKFSFDKSSILGQANLSAEKLRFWFRIAKDTQALPLKSHAHASRAIVAIAKQISGWRRHSIGRDNDSTIATE